MTSRRVLIVGALLLAGVAILAIGVGSVAIAPTDVIGILVHRLLGVGETAQSAGATSIVIELRLPRIMAAILVGAALAVVGGACVKLDWFPRYTARADEMLSELTARLAA